MTTYNASNPSRSLFPQQVGYSFGSKDGVLVSQALTSAARVTNVTTFTTTAKHPYKVGDTVVTSGTTPVGATSFNGTFVVATVPTGVTFTVADVAADDTATGGTVTGDATADALTGSAQAGERFAVPNAPSDFGPGSRSVLWSFKPNTAPSSWTVALQAAMTDVEADYVTVDSDTTVGGATKTATGVKANFLRTKVTAISLGNGAGLTSRICP